MSRELGSVSHSEAVGALGSYIAAQQCAGADRANLGALSFPRAFRLSCGEGTSSHPRGHAVIRVVTSDGRLLEYPHAETIT